MTDPANGQLRAFLQHVSEIQKKEHDQKVEIATLEEKISAMREEIEAAKSDFLAATQEQRTLVRDIAQAECQTAHDATENGVLRKEISRLETVRADKVRLIERYLHKVVLPAFQKHCEYSELAEYMRSGSCEESSVDSPDPSLAEPVEISHMKHHLAPYIPPKTLREMFESLRDLRHACIWSIAHNTPSGEICAPRRTEWFHPVCPRLTWNNMLAENPPKDTNER